ncbi:protein kinase [Verrucomicrobia bacterium]|nr:protein kinase [Verrucomicrobiota bacterium]
MDKRANIAILTPTFIVSEIIGKRVGHYEITAKLGQGGMGDVYRAVDTRLDREVAIKVLPSVFAEDQDRLARFGREAKVLASLDHANIASIFGVEAFEGQHCLILQLVEGEALSDRIARGPLEIDVALAIGKQIADALCAAHERGVIHRDLKPANVMIADDRTVKVLDFGLAKLSVADPESKLGQVMASTDSNVSTVALESTEHGMLFGTPAYMSPEQARGLMIDRRTDVWAFGCCLFEMLVGKKPFEGQTTTDLLAEVGRIEPDWASLPEDTPPAVLTLLRRCLEKEAHRRLSSTGDIAITLEETTHISGIGGSTLGRVRSAADRDSGRGGKTPAGRLIKVAAVVVLALGFAYALFDVISDWAKPSGVSVDGIRSIAVLPFDLEGGDEGLLVVASGLEELIREDLNRIGALERKIGASSVKKYRGSDLDERVIASALEVDGLVYGSIRQVEDKLEASIYLFHGPTANTFWTTNISSARPMLLKEQITLSVLEQFDVELLPEEQASLEQSEPVGLEAYTSYQQGLFYLDQYTPDSVAKAIASFEKAISQESDFLPPYISLAKAHWLPTIWGGHTGSAKEGLDLAKGVLAEAKSRFPNEPSIVRIQGYLSMIADFDWPRAKETIDQALISSSDDSEVYYQQCLYLLFVEGRYADALRSIEKALQINPESVAYLDALAKVYTFMGDEQKGLELNRESHDLHPNEWGRRLNVVLNLKNLGVKDPSSDWLDQALVEAKKGVEDSRRNPSLLAVLAEVHAARNESREVDSILTELTQQKAGGQFVPAVWVARVEAQRGKLDLAIQHLERGFGQREGNSFLSNLRKTDLMTLLSDHAGYWNLIQKMNYPALPIDHPFFAMEQSMRFRNGLDKAGKIRSIAVLPFLNTDREEHSSQWVSEAIRDEVLRRLRRASFDGLNVVGGRSLDGENGRTILEEARSLGVDAMVHGRFTVEDETLKVWTSFTDVGTGVETPLDYQEGSVSGTLDLASKIVTNIAKQVQPELSSQSLNALADDRGIDPSAFISYRKGLHALGGISETELKVSQDYFTESMRLDPDFVSPYLALGKSIWMPTIWGQTKMNPEQAFVQANSLLATAARYAPANSEVMAVKGLHALVGDWDWSRAHEYSRQAAETGSSTIPLAWYLSLVEARYAEAESVLDDVLQRDSARLDPLLVKAAIARIQGDWNRSAEIYGAIENSRLAWPDLLHHAESLFWIGSKADALAATRRVIEISERHPAALIQMAALLGFSEQEEEGEKILNEAQSAVTEASFFPSSAFAIAYLGLGDVSMALSSLESGFDEKGSWPMLELRRDTFLRRLGDEPRFWALVSAMKFPELPLYHEFHQKEQSMR